MTKSRQNSGQPSSNQPRNFVTFEAEFPDDTVWDERDNCAVPGGRNILTWVRDAVANHGLHCSSVEQHFFYGWDFEIGKCGVLLQFPGHWLLTCEVPTSLMRGVLKQDEECAIRAICKTLHEILSKDPRISKLLWHTRDDYKLNKHYLASNVPE